MPNSGSVDERIVELRIDHQKFETGAKKTIKILENLDEGLKNLGKQHTDGFDDISNSLDKVTNKISFFGTVGDQIIRNLTTKAMDLVTQFTHMVNSLTIDQVAAGWDKYADKTQGVQTIMAATAKDWADQGAQMEWVNEQLEKLNWFTDETSYNFLDMVNNIGKFTSNGVALESAVTSMEGISTWAALSGANAQEASRAMYNLSQAMATGSVKLIDWKSIENANMATREFKETALETALTLGTLENAGEGLYKILGKDITFTAEQFNTELSEGWFTSDVLIQTLEKYGSFTDALNKETTALGMTATEFLSAMEAYKEGNMEELGKIAKSTGNSVNDLIPSLEALSAAQFDLGWRAFKAAQEAKTFQEAVDATKDAVSTGWMNIYDKIFGNYLAAKELWTELAETFYNVFAEPINKINDLIDRAFLFDGKETIEPLREFSSYLQDAGFTVDDFVNSMLEVDPDLYERLSREFDDLDAAFKAGAIDAETFSKILLNMGAYDKYREAAGLDPRNQQQIEDYNYLIAHSAEYLDRWTRSAEDASKERIPGGELFREGLVNLMHLINDFSGAFLDAFDIVFGSAEERGDKLYSLLETFNNFTKGLILSEEQVEALRDRIAGSLNIFKSVITTIGSVFSFIKNIISTVIGSIKDSGILGSIGRSLHAIFQGLFTPIRTVIQYFRILFATTRALGRPTWAERLTKWLSKIGSFIEKISNGFKEFMESDAVVGTLAIVINAIVIAFQKLTSWIGKATSKIGNFLKGLSLSSKIGFNRDGLKGAFENIINYIRIFLKDHPIILGALSVIQGVLTALALSVVMLATGISTVIEKIRNSKGLQKAFTSIGEGFKNVQTRASSFFSTITTAFAQNGITGVFDTIKASVSSTWRSVQGFFSDFIDTIRSGEWDALREKYPFLDQLSGFYETVSGYIGQKWGDLVARFSAIEWDKLRKKYPFLDQLITFYETVSGYIGKKWDDLVTWFSSKDFLSKLPSMEEIGTYFSELFDSISSWFAELKEKLGSGNIGEVFSFIVQSIGNWFEKAKTRFSFIKTAISNFFASIGLDENIFTSLFDFIRNGASVFKDVGITALIIYIAKLVRNIGWIFDEISGLIGVPRLKAVRGIIYAIGVTILMLAGSLLLISMIPADRLFDVWATLTSILFAIGGVIGGLKIVGATKTMLAFAGVLSSIGILVLALYGLSKFTDDSFKNGMIRLVEILGVLFVFLKMSKNTSIGSTTGLLSVAVAMLAFMVVIKSISRMSSTDYIKGFLRFILILMSLVGFMQLTKNVSLGKTTWFIGMAAGLVALAFVLRRLSSMAKEDFSKGFIRLILLLLSIAGYLRLINGVKINVASLAALVAGIAAFVIVAVVLTKLADYDWDKIGKAALICILTLVSICAIVAGLGYIGPTAVIGTLILGAIILLLAGLIWALIELGQPILDSACNLADKLAVFVQSLEPFVTSISSFTDADQASFDRLASMMKSLVKAEFWALIAGVLSHLMNAEGFGERLSAFTSELAPFLESIKDLSEEDAIKAGYLADIMSRVAISEVWGRVGRIFNSLKSDYAKRLSSFTTLLKPFITNIKELNPEDSEKAGYLADIMSRVAISEVWGRVGIIFNSLRSDYAIRLSLFTTFLKPFINNIKELSSKDSEKAGYLADIMSGVAISEVWGRVGSAFESLKADYAMRLSLFTSFIKPFINNIKELSSKDSEKAGYLADIMSRVAISEVWGRVGEVFHGLSPMGALRLSSFIVALKPFISGLDTVSEDKTAQAKNLSKLMKEVTSADFWSAITGWIEKWKKKHDLDGLDQVAENLNIFITDLSPFFEMLNSLDPETFPNATAFMGFIADIGRNNIFTSFAGDLQGLYYGILLSDVDIDRVTSIIQATSDLIFSIINLRELISGVDGALDTDVFNLSEAISSSVSKAVTDAYIDEKVTANANALGREVAYGIAAGLDSGAGSVAMAAIRLANTINSSFSFRMGIHSPSRVMARLAAFIPAGVAQGIDENADVAEDSVTIMASGVIAAMQQAMLSVATLADENFEFSPTITPVVDLSNVTSAAGNANSLFGAIGSLMRGSVHVSLDTAQNTASAMQYGNSTDTIVDEMERLSVKLDQLGDAVTNMQIVLDTGALVGATSRQMDNAFGLMQARKGRGN